MIREMERASAAEICALSRALLDRALGAPGALEIVVSTSEALTRGAWGIDADCTDVRGGGGTKVAIGEGDIYVGLALDKSNALVADCDPPRLMNRHVRPLLRALAKAGTKAMYGGRDFIAVKGERVGWVGFQHSAETQRAAFEAIVPGSTPELRQLISDAYRAAYGDLVSSRSGLRPDTPELASSAARPSARTSTSTSTPTSNSTPTWIVDHDAIGAVAIAFDSGRFRVGGDFYASREIVPRLERALDAARSMEDVDRAIEDVCTTSDVVLEGLKSLDALTRAARAAFSASQS
jgi:hypothetical protein